MIVEGESEVREEQEENQDGEGESMKRVRRAWEREVVEMA